MKKLLTKAVLSAFLALAVISCKEDATSTPDTPPAETKDYYSMKVGTYWVYDWHEYNDQGVALEASAQDSLAVTMSEEIFSKTAFKIEKFSGVIGEAKNKGIEYHHAFNSDQLFVTSGFIESFKTQIPLPINIDFLALPTDKWYLMADSKQTTWNLLDTPIELKNQTIPNVPGITIDLSYQIIMTRKAEGTMTDPNDATKTVKTIEFEMKNSLGIKAKLGSADLGLTKPSVDLITYLVFAEGIGLIKGYTPNQDIKLSTVELPFVGAYEIINQKFIGAEMVLKKYKK